MLPVAATCFLEMTNYCSHIVTSSAMTCFYLPVLYNVADSNILIGPMSNSDVVSPGSCSTASVLLLEIHLYTTSLVVKPT